MKGLEGWKVTESSAEEKLISLQRTFSFRTHKKVVEFLQATLELSKEFLLNPTITVHFPKVTVLISLPIKERERGEIFAMAVEDIYFKLTS